MNNLAWILATCPDAKARNGSEAVQLAERACRRGGNRPAFLDTLAAAYAEAHRFADSTNAMQRAIALAEATRQTNFLPAFRSRLELYLAGKPYRAP
jgi:uncharacterized protein HemY